MSAHFREQLVALAQRSIAAAKLCTNEESAKMFLVLPVISFLGYNHLDPSEVYPEHHADFSEKYRNRVDFAILRDSQPIIAIECKGVGQSGKDDRGQLKSYFNAAKSVKMGILTDGLRWEFFADSEEANLMDDKPFLSLDIGKIAEDQIEDFALETMLSLRKDRFDPVNIGAEAKRKHIFNAVLTHVGQLTHEPPDQFCKMLLKDVGIDYVSQKTLGEYKPLIKQAFAEYVNQQILARMGILPREQVPAPVEAVAATGSLSAETKAVMAVSTTEAELGVFRWVQQRLAFLIRDEALFAELAHVNYRDYQGKFVVFYKRERKGRLFEFLEGRTTEKGVVHKFLFPDDVGGLPKEASPGRLEELDEALLLAFKARVAAS